MRGKQNPFVAREGLPFLGLVVVGIGAALQFGTLTHVGLLLILAAWLYLVFRDPQRPTR